MGSFGERFSPLSPARQVASFAFYSPPVGIDTSILNMKALLLVWIATCALIHANAVVPWIWGPVLDNKHVTGAHIELCTSNPYLCCYIYLPVLTDHHNPPIAALNTGREFGKTDARYLRNDNLIMSLEGMMVRYPPAFSLDLMMLRLSSCFSSCLRECQWSIMADIFFLLHSRSSQGVC